MKLLKLLVLLLATTATLAAQEKFTLSGYVKDAETGETLIGANVFYNSKVGVSGTVTNLYGFYSLTLPAGEYDFEYNYIGFESIKKTIVLDKDISQNVELGTSALMLDQDVVITGRKEDDNVSSADVGKVELSVDKLKTLPAFMGEVDVLKSIQLLPGVQASGEGNAGFYVRGGGADQNLILLDDATVYNTGHLFGFFSVFNADALKNTTIIKGGMPAQYGGRLSSVLDVTMKEGNNKRFQADGGIGLIASRLTLQGPIQKNKSSFIISGRRTYISELAQPQINKTDFAGSGYYFYDLNAKVNYTFSDKDRVYLSGYFGRDVFTFANADRDFTTSIPWGNATGTLRWNHLFTDKLFMNATAVYNSYNFKFGVDVQDFKIEYFSGIRDYNFKVDFDYFPSLNHKVKFGMNYTWHKFSPSRLEANVQGTEVEPIEEINKAHEVSVYVQDEWDVTDKLKVNVGLRAALFAQVGPYDYTVSRDSVESFGEGELVKAYPVIEPRLNFRYRINDATSLKGSVTYNTQFVHLVANSASTLPTDTWLPSSKLIKPQTAWQYSLGWFQNFAENKYEASIEVFYKSLGNQIDYTETYVPTGPPTKLEDNFVFGRGRAYGAEFFVKKRLGKLNGWLGYTLSRSERIFDLEGQEINGGSWFVSTFDRPHDISLALNYEISPKWVLGGVWVYASGQAVTIPKELAIIQGTPVTLYGERNSYRIDAYHRMDLSLTYIPNPKKDKRLNSEFNLSIYNVYNRNNIYYINFVNELTDTTGDGENDTYQNKALAVSLFPIIPSITWNFSF